MTGTIFIILAFLLLLAGLVGAVVPVLPGPPLSYAGLLLLHFTGQGTFTPAFLLLWAAISAVVVIADNFLPAWMTKSFGGSRYAVTGSVLGLLAGMFLIPPPAGFIAGPFLGAFIGELLYNRADGAKALKVALGSFLAFILGTGAKLAVSSLMIFYAVMAVLAK